MPRPQVGQPKGSLKLCGACGRTSLQTLFNGGTHNMQLGRPSKWCLECMRLRARAKRYGISTDELLGMMRRCGGFCETGCGKRAVVVDHCHETNVVRGLVCHSCNMGIGQIGDTLEAAKRVVTYLEKSLRNG